MSIWWYENDSADGWRYIPANVNQDESKIGFDAVWR